MEYDDYNKEYEYSGMVVPGFLMLFVTFIIIPAIIVWIGLNFDYLNRAFAITAIVVLGIGFLFFSKGYLTQEPNESRVFTFFGKYVGTFRRTGFYWVNPFISRSRISLRIRNMDINPIKVNDKIGNPVMIGMVLVWRIKDTYKCVFDIDSSLAGTSGLGPFVKIQSDAALREVTGYYAYDETSEIHDEITLRSGGSEINDLLERKINERVSMAGIEVIEARINYLAYAPEIAAVMLRRQQATAIVTAREKIVEGAVSMVKMALDSLENQGVVHLDENHKAAMVSNLLVVLCADEAAQPVLNTGA